MLKIAATAVAALTAAAGAQVVSVTAPTVWDVTTQGTTMNVVVSVNGGALGPAAVYDLMVVASGEVASLANLTALQDSEFTGMVVGTSVMAYDSVFGSPTMMVPNGLNGAVFSFDVNLTGNTGTVDFAIADGGLIPTYDRLAWGNDFFGTMFANPYPTGMVQAVGATTQIVPAPGAAVLLGAGGLLAFRRR